MNIFKKKILFIIAFITSFSCAAEESQFEIHKQISNNISVSISQYGVLNAVSTKGDVSIKYEYGKPSSISGIPIKYEYNKPVLIGDTAIKYEFGMISSIGNIKIAYKFGSPVSVGNLQITYEFGKLTSVVGSLPAGYEFRMTVYTPNKF
jgi:hypothetical protein